MVHSSVKFGSLVSIFAVLWILYFRVEDEIYVDTRIDSVAHSLLKIERKFRVGKGTAKPRVAVGYGACHDVFANAVPLLNPSEFDGEPAHFDDISSSEELLKSFAYYFQYGAAAERFMSNTTLFEELVDKASKQPGVKWALGGNAPVMASRFFVEGCEVMMAGKMTDVLKKYIPQKLIVVGGESVDQDDVHLILEYKANQLWGPYTAPRANRYILHNDENNPMVSSLEPFNEVLEQFNPNLLVVSGLQMMDSYPFEEGVRESRLEKIQEQMMNQSNNTLIHFEMASYVEAKLLIDLIDLIVPYTDSVGMNEQELANLYQVLRYGNISFVSDSNPRVASALDQMREIFQLISTRNTMLENSRTLSRIHVHTLAYQAILTVKGSSWKHTMASAAKASLMAHRHVCSSKDILMDQVKLVMDDSFATSAIDENAPRILLNPSKPVSCWSENIKADKNVEVEICIAPVLVCTNARQTAGAGDNISAAGLVLQI